MKTTIIQWVISSAIALVVTSYISFALVAINAGFTQDFLMIWGRSWLIAFIMALPSLLFVGPAIKKKASALIQEKGLFITQNIPIST